MILKRIEIAYPGMHGSSETKLTEEVIQDAIRTFKGVVPATISHEAAKQEKIPAVGKVIHVDRPKQRLEAVVELSDELARMLINGEINSWSPGFRQGADGWYLHHLAFSGSVPGKMRDLKILAELPSTGEDFADGENGTILTFTDTTGDLKTMKEDGMSIEELAELVKSSIEKLDGVISDVKELKEKEQKKSPEGEGNQDDPKEKEFSDKLKAANEKVAKMQKESLLKNLEGKLPKDQLDKVANFLDTAKGKEMLFTDGEEDNGVAGLLSSVFASIQPKNLEGEVVFSDAGTKDGTAIDYGSLAAKL